MRRAENIEGPEQVNVDYRFERIAGHSSGAAQEVTRGSRDQHVNESEALLGALERGGHFVRLAYIGREAKDAAHGSAAQSLDRGVDTIVLTTHNDDVRACGCERLRDPRD